jgi:hypothetical protein
MRTVTRALVGAVLAAAPGCDAQSGGGTVPLVPSDAVVTAVQRLGPWGYSGLEQPARSVITDAGTWQQTWTALWSRHSSPPSVPAVDFGADAVVLVAMGTRPSGGHAIRIDDVSRSGDVIYVRVTQSSPGPTCITTAALTQPADAVVVPGGRGAEVRFVERTAREDC